MRNNRLTSLAKQLREQSTDAERLLWRYLRSRRLDGYKFRRQQPIGKYIVDFICLEKPLIIELDGGQHAAAADRDELRDNFMVEQGYEVLRFWNNDVLGNTSGVLEAISIRLSSGQAPSP